MSESAGTMLQRIDAAISSGMKPVGGEKGRPATGAVLRLTDAVAAQHNVHAVLKEAQDKAELERLTASLIRQGKALPMQHRTIDGQLVTKWIGSTRAFLAPFSEPPQKVNLGDAGAARDARLKAAAQKEAARYEQMGRAMARERA